MWKLWTAVHLYLAVKCGCHWPEFRETRKCKQNFGHASCTGCVYLTAEFCARPMYLMYLTAEFLARPVYRMCVSHCRILGTPHVPDVSISLQNSVHVPCTGCVFLTRDNICELQIRPAFHPRPSIT